MKFSSPLASITTLFALQGTVAAAYWKGFNMAAQNQDGSCRTQAQWEYGFNKMKGIPGGSFTGVRVFASSDCNTLANAVPAALNTGVKILVGVWTEDSGHYGAEKAALQAAIKAHGTGWILAISVGSEDLYRKDTNANTLAQQIYDVRGMVRAMGVNAQVGHVDTWTAWVDPANTAVIKACDFIGNDAYPYWQGVQIQDAYNTFWSAMNNVRNVVNSVKPGTAVWITETGWPVEGPNFGSSVPSVANAKSYWRSVACSAFGQAHTFWYSYQDYAAAPNDPSFGVIGRSGQNLYASAC